jgi:photosystem II stability/assembly factor-like uncharacterized protein
VDDVTAPFFVDRTHGFAEVDWRLARTDDGGQTWRTVGSPIPADELNYLPGTTVFTSLEDGYLYGRGIRVTHDGGMTWSNPHLARHVDPADGAVDGDVLAFEVRRNNIWALIACVDGSGCVDRIELAS